MNHLSEELCPACRGTGYEPAYVHGTYLLETCQVCKGTGFVQKRKNNWLLWIIIIITVSYIIRKLF